MFTPDRVRTAAAAFKPSTSLGVGQLPFALVAELPDDALQALCDLYTDMWVDLAFPVQTFAVLMHLLPKKLGGYRTIAVLPTLYRLFMKLV